MRQLPGSCAGRAARPCPAVGPQPLRPSAPASRSRQLLLARFLPPQSCSFVGKRRCFRVPAAVRGRAVLERPSQLATPQPCSRSLLNPRQDAALFWKTAQTKEAAGLVRASSVPLSSPSPHGERSLGFPSHVTRSPRAPGTRLRPAAPRPWGCASERGPLYAGDPSEVKPLP